jgi:hypothetical protein
MSTMHAIPSPADHPGLGQGVHRLRERLLVWLQPAGSCAPANWQDFDINPQGLIHDHRAFDRAEEYKRQAVDRALAACPYLY